MAGVHAEQERTKEPRRLTLRRRGGKGPRQEVYQTGKHGPRHIIHYSEDTDALRTARRAPLVPLLGLFRRSA